MGMHQTKGFTEHRFTAHTGSPGIRTHTEQRADITQSSGRQQCIDGGMHGDIAIRITLDTIAFPFQTGKKKRSGIAGIGEPMRVESQTVAQIRRIAHFFFDFLLSDSRRANVSCAGSSGASV